MVGAAAQAAIDGELEFRLHDLFFLDYHFRVVACSITVLAAAGFGRVEILRHWFFDSSHIYLYYLLSYR